MMSGGTGYVVPADARLPFQIGNRGGGAESARREGFGDAAELNQAGGSVARSAPRHFG
jgi:hypothetical protein